MEIIFCISGLHESLDHFNGKNTLKTIYIYVYILYVLYMRIIISIEIWREGKILGIGIF